MIKKKTKSQRIKRAPPAGKGKSDFGAKKRKAKLHLQNWKKTAGAKTTIGKREKSFRAPSEKGELQTKKRHSRERK